MDEDRDKTPKETKISEVRERLAEAGKMMSAGDRLAQRASWARGQFMMNHQEMTRGDADQAIRAALLLEGHSISQVEAALGNPPSEIDWGDEGPTLVDQVPYAATKGADA